MSAITGTPKNSWLLSSKLPKSEARLDDAESIARAIAQLMDPEWQELVDREQQKHRTDEVTKSTLSAQNAPSHPHFT